MTKGNLYIEATALSPEIHFNPEKNIFYIKGNSAPEDVRALYYPVIEWIKEFIDGIIEGEQKVINPLNPLKIEADFNYFNSSSAKFLFDIFLEIKRLSDEGIPVIIDWYFDEEDSDMQEAGEDIAQLTGIKFNYIPK